MALATPTAVVLELMTMGQQSAAHLGELLRAASPTTTLPPGEQLQNQALAAEILRCCDRVIAAMSRCHPGVADTAAAANKKRKATDVPAGFAAAAGPSPPSRRARGGAEARGVVVESGTTEDGFAWRKYGQKDINGCKHPRLYYRCAYRGEGCVAKRRVQRSRDEPAAYAIAYYGEHKCGQGDGAAAAFQQQAAGTAAALLPAPTVVVDFGSNNASGLVDVCRDRGSALLPLIPAGSGASRRGWSSPSSSSSSELELGASPSPVMEFLEGSFDWESVVNSLGFGDLPLVAMLQ